MVKKGGCLSSISKALTPNSKDKKSQSSPVNNRSSSSAPLPLSCVRFSLREIKRATNNFTDKNIVLSVGCGFVYRGNISGNSYRGEVFVIRLQNQKWHSESLMLENEIKVLTARHHVNIISLLGFCDENDAKILVYKCMPNGSLYHYLHICKYLHPRLTVEQHLEICLGVAKGLCYLHAGNVLNVVHGQINSKNILLDASLVPKISCFGYATTGAAGQSSSQGRTTNRLDGQDGYYLPPECRQPRYKVSQKSDVYAFGVVLLEVLCERDPRNRLFVLAVPFIRMGELPKATPEHVKENITPACARQCVKLIMGCLELQPEKRPCMNQVVQDLELALNLQKNQDNNFKEQSSHATNRCQSLSPVEIKKATDELSSTSGEGAFGKVYYGKSSLVNNQSSSFAPLSLSCLRFPLGEIIRATNDFSYCKSVDDGKVWSGNISGNSYSGEVFIKRIQKSLLDATLIFQNEIKVLTAHQHVNIISLVGFCDEEDEKILVYEFMPNRSLYDYLYRPEVIRPHLTMEQRLGICLGVAKGLCYLHSGTDSNVVHCQISNNNILLDASLVPKISGFRYATSSSQEITTNRLHDANGYYAPPEYHEPGYKVSEKSDVYAFGVILLEALCEREPRNRLLVMALPFIMKGDLPKSTPEYVKKNITPACGRLCEKLIMECLEFQPGKRPGMSQVVRDLELAIKLQKNQDIKIKKQSSGVNNRCQSFSLVEIKRATNELSNTLGEGAFGKVYFGKISYKGNVVDVAVKIMSTDPERGIPAFEIEKKLLLACDHVNIISLLGYCDEEAEKILVYEFMPNGSLYDYLKKHMDNTPRLTMEQRLEICKGVAKGLCYLHSRSDYNIIHSDLKTENILLDANLVPKISDFGLSRTRDVGPFTSSIITNHIQGTQGYIAPECYEPNYKLSRKADVYAFGVVLLEVLCEKPAWERLVIWALPFVSKGELPKFTPEHVMKNITPECSRACANLIRDCLDNDPNNRPAMSHVIGNLDLALTLQKMNADGNGQKSKFQASSQKRFSVSDIGKATNKFACQNLLLKNQYYKITTGKVYRGNISVDVAVKRMTGKTHEADHLIDFNTVNERDYKSFCQEYKAIFQKDIDLFEIEIDSLSTCHHANVISLVGYCDEPDEKILIYEFMHNGSLYDHLHSKHDSANHLTVQQRLEICLGVAKGLCYIHSSNIIHGSLYSKNILLDRNFGAKITGFEFSRKCVAGLTTSQQTIDAFLGMMREYLAPECDEHNYKVSQEADVYAFGVVFLEVFFERPASSKLITSALQFIATGELAKFVPEHLRTYISQKCAQACESLLKDCLDGDPDKRPFMNQVVENLELALKLQKEDANY